MPSVIVGNYYSTIMSGWAHAVAVITRLLTPELGKSASTRGFFSDERNRSSVCQIGFLSEILN